MKIETINKKLYIYHESNTDVVDPRKVHAYEIAGGVDIFAGRDYYAVNLYVHTDTNDEIRFTYTFDEAYQAKDAKRMIYDNLLPFILK